MSCKQKRGKSIFLFVATVYFYVFQLCCSVSLGQWEDGFTATEGERIKQDKTPAGQHTGTGYGDLRESNEQRLHKLQLQPGSGEPHPHLSAQDLKKSDVKFVPESLSWNIGNVSVKPKSSTPESVHGHQADFTG